jgi:mono/diheme cytochrome c family protein
MIRFLKAVVLCIAPLSFVIALPIYQDSRLSGFHKDTTSSRMKRVNELFKQHCARCHGPDGRGETQLGQVFNAPDFTDSEFWKSKNRSTRTLRVTVTNGKGGMPAFGKELTRAEINLLVDRVRKFRKVS